MKLKGLFAAACIAITASAGALAGNNEKLYAAGKMETSVWEATAATYMHEFHYSMHTDHENRRLALMDLENDVALFEKSLATLKVELPGQNEQLEKIAMMWTEFIATARKTISMTDDGSTDHHHLHMKLWHGAENLNTEIDKVMAVVMKH
jgi:hypothetical protein